MPLETGTNASHVRNCEANCFVKHEVRDIASSWRQLWSWCMHDVGACWKVFLKPLTIIINYNCPLYSRLTPQLRVNFQIAKISQILLIQTALNPVTLRVNYGNFQCSVNCCVWERNPVVSPLKWNLFSSIFTRRYLFFNTLQNEIWYFSWLWVLATLGKRVKGLRGSTAFVSMFDTD